MMTRRKTERITGLKVESIVRCESSGWDSWLVVARRGDEEPLYVTGESREEALKGLVESNLARVRNDLARKQKWRCADCGQRKPLQLHHKIRRSKGRDDRPENGIMLCAACHAKREGR